MLTFNRVVSVYYFTIVPLRLQEDEKDIHVYRKQRQFAKTRGLAALRFWRVFLILEKAGVQSSFLLLLPGR